MKAKSKNNSNTFQGWLEAQLWNASLQPRSMVGAGNAVKGRDQLRCASPLTAFPAQYPRLSRFSLDTAVVVIDRMTDFKVWRHAKLNYCLISLRQNLKASPRSHGGDGGTWSIQRRTPPGSSMLNKHKWTSIHMCGRRIGARRLLL